MLINTVDSNNTSAALPGNFTVNFVPQEEYDAAYGTMKVWAQIAGEKAKQARGEDQIRFESSEDISGRTADYLDQMEPSAELYVCKDGADLPQGYMVLTFGPKTVIVDMLFTHPNHIQSPLNPDRVRGIGTELMYFAEDRAVDDGYEEVFVSSFTDAMGFYRKLGYTSESTTQPHRMRKSVEKIKASYVDFAA